MGDGLILIIGEDGVARQYDDTYDIVIHCESAEEQDKVRKMLPLVNLEKLEGVTKIEPEPTRGRWIKENIVLTSNPPQYQWHCSECGTTMYGYSAEILTSFCTNCGADMRRKE